MNNLTWLRKTPQIMKQGGGGRVAFISSINNAKSKAASDLIANEQSACPELKKLTIDDIPGPKPSIPILGTSWQYTKFGPYAMNRLHEANFHKYSKYGKIMKEEFRKGRPMVQLFDPADFETVFRSQGKQPQRPPLDAVCHYRLSQPHKYKSVGLTNADGNDWYNLRSALAPVLMKLSTIVAYLPQQNLVCLDFIRLLHHAKDKNYVIHDFQAQLYKLALESVAMLCLDTRLGCLDPNLSEDSEAARTIAAAQGLFEAFQLLYYGLPLWKWYKTSSYKLLEESETVLYNTVSKYIDKALLVLEESKPSFDRQSILEALVSAPNIHPKDIRMTIIDFIAAGIDTASNTLTFAFYQMAKNQHIQQELYDEINRVIPDKGEFTAEKLPQMPYLRATIKEVFRVSPTIPGIGRVTNTDHVLAGYHVPKDTLVFCHSMVASNTESFVSEPEKFNPRRWIGKKNIHPFTVLPFGFGSRACVGRRFAEQQIYAITVKVLQHFRLELAQEKLGSIFRFLVIPDDKLRLKLIDRT